jgi:hypothetical protein
MNLDTRGKGVGERASALTGQQATISSFCHLVMFCGVLLCVIFSRGGHTSIFVTRQADIYDWRKGVLGDPMDRLSDWDGMEYCTLIFRTRNFIPFSCMIRLRG